MRYLLDTDIVVHQLRGKSKLKEEIVDHGFISDLKVDILGLSQEIMDIYAQTKTLLEIKGKRLDEFDLLIGATAIVHSLSLATLNLRHFSRITDLRMANNFYTKTNK